MRERAQERGERVRERAQERGRGCGRVARVRGRQGQGMRANEGDGGFRSGGGSRHRGTLANMCSRMIGYNRINAGTDEGAAPVIFARGNGMTDNEVARQDEVLAALTRILRREATESAIVNTRSRVPTLCADGKVRYAERTETRVVEIPPRISDVNRAADLLGRRCGLWSERTEAARSDVRIVDDVGAAGPEDGAAECSGAGKRGSRGEDGGRSAAGRKTGLSLGEDGAGPEGGATAGNGRAGKRECCSGGRRSGRGGPEKQGRPRGGRRGGRTRRGQERGRPREDGAAECGGSRKAGSCGEDGAANTAAGQRGSRAEDSAETRRTGAAAECSGAESGRPRGGRRGGVRRGRKVRRQRQGAARAEHPPGGNPYGNPSENGGAV